MVVVLTAINYWWQGRMDVALILIACGLTMPVGLWINHYRSSYAASVLLMLSITTALAAIMWRSDGLADSALLGFPVILVGAAQMFRPRHFLAVVVFMLSIVLLLGLGTLFGWRTVFVAGTHLDRITDTISILAIGGYLTWLLTNDMQKAQKRLRQQIRSLQASEVSGPARLAHAPAQSGAGQ
jgi:hypothetical protein